MLHIQLYCVYITYSISSLTTTILPATLGRFCSLNRFSYMAFMPGCCLLSMTPWPQGGAFSQVFACFSRTKFITWCLRHPIRKMLIGSIIFGTVGHVHFGPCLVPTVKQPRAILHLDRKINKYSHMVYMTQTSMYLNSAKLLIQPK